MSTIKTWQERVAPSIYNDFVRRGYGMVHAAMFAEIAELRTALAASGGNAASIDPTVQGMADCMHMVQQELIEADAIPGGTAPMFIANEVVRKLNSYKRENLELKRVYDERGEQIKRLDIALERAASAPNAALVAALESAADALENVEADRFNVDMDEVSSAASSARMALSAAGQEVGK